MKSKTNTRPLRCPVCKRGRLADGAARLKPEQVLLLPPDSAAEASIFLKCPKCASEIGVVLDTH